MSEKIILIDKEQVRLRRAQGLEEVLQVQELDTATWPEGYRYYTTLYDLDPNSIYVAVNQYGKIISYIGVERINPTDLGVGMPPWNHDPRNGWHKPNGDTWYITGHVVDANYHKSGLSHETINYLKQMAQPNGIQNVSVILRINHPTLGKASKFWERHGFMRLEYTLDPNWKASPIAKDSGGVIYAVSLTK